MEGVIQLSAGKVAAEENLFSSFLTPERVSWVGQIQLWEEQLNAAKGIHSPLVPSVYCTSNITAQQTPVPQSIFLPGQEGFAPQSRSGSSERRKWTLQTVTCAWVPLSSLCKVFIQSKWRGLSGEETKHSSTARQLLRGKKKLLLWNDAGTNKNNYLPFLTSFFFSLRFA